MGKENGGWVLTKLRDDDFFNLTFDYN